MCFEEFLIYYLIWNVVFLCQILIFRKFIHFALMLSFQPWIKEITCRFSWKKTSVTNIFRELSTQYPQFYFVFDKYTFLTVCVFFILSEILNTLFVFLNIIVKSIFLFIFKNQNLWAVLEWRLLTIFEFENNGS